MRAVFWAMVLLTLATWQIGTIQQSEHLIIVVQPSNSPQVIYFFAVFTVHYVGEMFRNDAATLILSSSMGEAMFTLPGAQFPSLRASCLSATAFCKTK